MTGWPVFYFNFFHRFIHNSTLALRLFNSQLEALALREEFQADEFDDRSAPMAEEMVKVDLFFFLSPGWRFG